MSCAGKAAFSRPGGDCGCSASRTDRFQSFQLAINYGKELSRGWHILPQPPRDMAQSQSHGRPAKRALEGGEEAESAAKRPFDPSEAIARAKAIALAKAKALTAASALGGETAAPSGEGPQAVPAKDGSANFASALERAQAAAAALGRANLPEHGATVPQDSFFARDGRGGPSRVAPRGVELDLTTTGITRLQRKRPREAAVVETASVTVSAPASEPPPKENPYLASTVTERFSMFDPRMRANLGAKARKYRKQRGLQFLDSGDAAGDGGDGGDDIAEAHFEPATTSAEEETATASGVPPMPPGWLEVPDVEPWDQVLLLSATELRKREQAISASEKGRGVRPAPLSYSAEALASWEGNVPKMEFIEHPAEVAPALPPKPAVAIPLILTKEEKRKERRKRRLEREQTRQLQQILGQVQPDAGKISVGNMARTLASQSAANPTAMEAHARAEQASRELNHDMRNLARKLTPEEKREKKRLKFAEGEGEAVHVALFRLLTLSHPSLRFKVGENTKQYYLSGRAIMCPSEQVAVVVVEGGQKGVKAFQQLMLRRVPWKRILRDACVEVKALQFKDDGDEKRAKRIEDLTPVLELEKAGLLDEHDDDDKTDDEPNRFCELVWTGTMSSRLFEEFRFETCAELSAGRGTLNRVGRPQWWDMAVRKAPAASTMAAAAPAPNDLPDLDELLA
jgi:hypothetical protein